MRTRTPCSRYLIALAAAAACLATATACSSSSTTAAAGNPGSAGRPAAAASGTNPSASGPRNSDYDATEAIVQCYRQHGDPSFPGAVYDPAGGNWHFGISPNTAPPATRQACQHLFPTSNPSPPVPQAEFQELLRYAQCMRQHGVHDWPDPTVSGDFALPHDLLTKTPAGEAAGNACSPYVPSGGLNVSAAG